MNWEELVKRINELNLCPYGKTVNEHLDSLDATEVKNLIEDWNNLAENTSGPDNKQMGYGFILRSMRRIILAKETNFEIPELKGLWSPIIEEKN